MPRRGVMLISGDDWGWTDLRRVLAGMPQLQTVGEVTTPEEAIRLATAAQPDVIISAARLGVTPTRSLLGYLQREICPAATVIQFSTTIDSEDRAVASDLRLDGHLVWGELTPERLASSLAALIAGGVVLHSRGVISHFLAQQDPDRAVTTLAAIERAVLRGLAAELSSAEIAANQGVSQRTVDRAIGDLKKRFGVRTQYGLALEAIRRGLIE